MADLAIDPQSMELNPPLVLGNPSYHDLTEQISAIIESDVEDAAARYWITLAITGLITLPAGLMLTYLVCTGIGVWGNNSPGRLGVGHHQLRVLDRYRPRRYADLGDSVPVPAKVANVDQPFGRSDDAVRRAVRRHLPAVPHRPSVARVYWLFPIPNTDLNMWQNFRSPLIWDVFAVSTYFTVSLLFWFTGLVPDLATLARSRDQPRSARWFSES